MSDRMTPAARGDRVLAGYAWLVLALLVLPLIALIPISLGDSPTVSVLPDKLSLRWYREVLGGAEWRSAFWWSLATASVATLISTSIGYLGAYAIVHSQSRLKGMLEVLMLMPMMVPTVIVAFSTYVLATWMPANATWLMISVGQGLLGLPVATLIIAASLRGIDGTVIRAAVSLGGDRRQVFAFVTLPMAIHGIVSAAALSFLIAFDELLIAVFLTRPGIETLPVRIYDSVTYELTPAIAVVSVFLMALVCLAMLAGEVIRRLAANAAVNAPQ
ncbi:ABC transporter permease [Tropicimonas isoalkanivorans]|uniref:Putative spermidine/putrescine transport system permease protein n=1 Tax=Tropicimonas isoalkanivorans TaxID=441112 RepID=A0A1I1HPA8_9RHOB|nr:ABC transporter permease [Tropicimonas isoalkanivorans]SFC25402.1 putative spermidine/putrescine transport system permease protein [Tropicimonas isoalkanivorans]